ncbi:hypothetical protein L1987_46796 [Smallanthus sonchifolius]|uniref:Uncharacterized protein n=1 Tax=Smallanthus sonchifolius TaxID=185202 RepID=A0ACB9G1T1_9ASTR|nr:hypothetical protein L1987_46796 [Smallanthus sonchifolius]
MGLATPPVDEHTFTRPFNFQGATRESSGEQVTTITRSYTSDQFSVSYQDRNMFGSALSQTEIDQRKFGKGQEQDIVNPSQEFSSLDTLERKFLFNTDDDNLGGFGNMFEDTDNVQAVPSLQSGSWSALMQSALEETSSTDTGVQEEWSGLSFQNPELSNDNQPSALTPWQNNIFQNASSLKTSNTCSSFPGFQHSHKEAGEFEASAQVQRSSPLQVHKGSCGHAGEFKSTKGLLTDNEILSKASDMTTFRSSDSSLMSASIDKSVGFPAPDLNSQASRHMLELLHKVDKFREYKHGTQSACTESAPTNEMPKAENTDAFTPSNNSSVPQYVGLMLGPPTQRPPVNYFDLSQISQQAGTSNLVPLKDQDGQRSSIFEGQQVSNSTTQPNVWVDTPSQQNLSGVRFHKAPSGSPSTSDASFSRIEISSEALKESGSHIYVKGGNDLLEATGHVLNSQGFDCTRGQEGKIPSEKEYFSGCAEVNASSLKQAHIPPLNPIYSDPNIRVAVKNEKADSDTKVRQLTSMSQLTSVYENYKTMLMPSAARDGQLVKLYGNSSFVQMNLASTSQNGRVWPVTGTSSLAIDQDLPVSQSKKRKFPTYELLPWHKEAAKGSSRLQDMSTAEVEWAQAAKRVPEKLKEEAQALGNSTCVVHPKKRVILTTQLMQVLFRPAPAAILSDDATSCYNTLTYFAARLALGDACSLSNHFYMSCNMPDSLSGKSTISKGSGDQNLSKIVEDFINRAKELENRLLRLENGGSVLEIRILSQDLERFSLINRFAKFHSRAQMAAAEAAFSGGASTVPKLYPQRYVTACPMPMIVPQGYNCLSL